MTSAQVLSLGHHVAGFFFGPRRVQPQLSWKTCVSALLSPLLWKAQQWIEAHKGAVGLSQEGAPGH